MCDSVRKSQKIQRNTYFLVIIEKLKRLSENSNVTHKLLVIGK